MEKIIGEFITLILVLFLVVNLGTIISRWFMRWQLLAYCRLDDVAILETYSQDKNFHLRIEAKLLERKILALYKLEKYFAEAEKEIQESIDFQFIEKFKIDARGIELLSQSQRQVDRVNKEVLYEIVHKMDDIYSKYELRYLSEAERIRLCFTKALQEIQTFLIYHAMYQMLKKEQ